MLQVPQAGQPLRARAPPRSGRGAGRLRQGGGLLLQAQGDGGARQPLPGIDHVRGQRHEMLLSTWPPIGGLTKEMK